MKNVTDEYKDMIIAFQSDFYVADIMTPHQNNILTLELPYSKKLIKDIELLKKLEWGLRYGKLKIMEMN